MEKLYNILAILSLLAAVVASNFIRDNNHHLYWPASAAALTFAVIGIFCLYKREQVDAAYREIGLRNRRQHGGE